MTDSDSVAAGESSQMEDGTGFAVYSTEYDPQRLYSRGDVEAIDDGLVDEVVQFADRPLDFYIDLGMNQLLWSFKGERHTKSTRTGYFIAAYQGGDELFQGFETRLRQLHDSDEWAIPYTGDPRWDVGFELWRIPPEVPGLSHEQFETLVDRINDRTGTVPLEFGMRTHRSALQVVTALEEADVDCTVAIGTGGDRTLLSDVDLLLVPGAERDFEPRSASATEVVAAEPESSGSETLSSVQTPQRSHLTTGSFISGIAGALVLVCLGFAAYSFVSPTPVQPITGLATVGGFIGALAALTTGHVLLAPGDRPDIRQAARTGLLSNTNQSLSVIAYGTFLGYGFPRIMWEVGLLFGRDGFLFSSVSTVFGAFLNLGIYAPSVFAVSAGILLVRHWRRSPDHRSLDLLVAAAVGHVAYALCLFVATGLAGTLWFRFLPSAAS